MIALKKTEIQNINDLAIVRDDLLPGGTKRRALVKYLPQLNSDHFIYAASVYGSGGWALAEACRDLGFNCTLALAKSPYRPPWLDLIECEIKWFDAMPVQDIYNSFEGHQGLLPLGFDDPDFQTCLVDVFRETDINNPPEIWMPCVSGTLIRAAQLAWPDIRMNAVCVAKHHGDLGEARKYQAKEKYHQKATEPPPYPANAFSDAKLWSFVRQFALKHALIWNTSN